MTVRIYNEYEKRRFSSVFQERLRYTNPYDHKIFLLYEEGEERQRQGYKRENKNENHRKGASNLVGMIEISFQPIDGTQVPSCLKTTPYLKKKRLGFN